MNYYVDCVQQHIFLFYLILWRPQYFSRGGVKNLYQLSRTVVWIVASSSVILFAPVIFEVERAQVEEMQKSQQKQVGTIIINDLRPFVGSDLFTKISPCISIVSARFPIICIIAFLQYYIHQENLWQQFTIVNVTKLPSQALQHDGIVFL